MKSLSERNKERKELYKKGLNDREIAEKQGVHKSSVQEWRDRRNLPPNAEPGESYNYRDVPSEEEVKESILKSSDLREVASDFGVCRETFRKWLEQMGFPKTPKGCFSVPWIKMSYNKEGIVKISKKYSAAEAARRHNTSSKNVQRFLRYHDIDWSSNGSSNPPEKKEIEPFLPIEGEYFKLENSGCDCMIMRGENKCILIEEKSSLSDYTLSEGARELMIAEKIVEDYFGLTSQRKIIYCGSPDSDSIQASKVKRTKKYLDIEIWGWNYSQNEGNS